MLFSYRRARHRTKTIHNIFECITMVILWLEVSAIILLGNSGSDCWFSFLGAILSLVGFTSIAWFISFMGESLYHSL